MTALSIQVPYQIFADSDGTPLDNGYVWIGTTNLDPRTNPINVYFDAALTQVAPNPLRTVNGYVYNAGSPAQLYIDGVNFSIRVEDKKSVLVYSFPSGSGISPNANGVVYLPAGTGAVATTVQSKLQESVSVKDFGAVSGGSIAVNDAAFARARAITNRYYIPPGTYALSASPDPFLDCFTSGNGVTLVVGGVSYDCSNAFAGPLRYVAASASKTNIVHAKTGNVIQYWQDGGPGTATGFYRGLAFTTDSHWVQAQPSTNGGSTDILWQRSTLNADPGGNRFNETFDEANDRLLFSYATTLSGSPSFDAFFRCYAGTAASLDFPSLAPTFRQGWSMQDRAETGYKMSFVIGTDRHHIKDFAGTFTHMTFKSDGAVGFFGAGGVTRPTVTGSRGANAALASVLTALSQLGLITDSTTA